MKRKELWDLADAPWRLERVSLGPATHCDCCGARIKDNFHFAGADERRFILGSTCFTRATMAVADPEAAGEVRELALKALKLAKRLADREKAPASPRQVIVDAKLMLEVDPSLGRNKPHPFSSYAARGKTARDYGAFCVKHAKRPEARRDAANFISRLWNEAQRLHREKGE
jgi:hypothetical protein